MGSVPTGSWSRSVGARTLDVWPTPRRRYRAREAGWISVRPPRPRRSQVLEAGKFLRQPAVRDGLHAYRHLPIETDRAVPGNSFALAPACQGRCANAVTRKAAFCVETSSSSSASSIWARTSLTGSLGPPPSRRCTASASTPVVPRNLIRADELAGFARSASVKRC
jgi:hypothetical protein